MSEKTYVVGPDGVTRFPKRICIADSTATTRIVKRIFVSDAGGVSRLIFTGADYLTLIAGQGGGTTGYVSAGFGTLTPAVLGDGATVTELAAATAGSHSMTLFVQGYAGTIGSSYLLNITINTSVFPASSATFSGGSSGGAASWMWTTGFNFIDATTYAVAIQRSA
jgi:hypothetical protein